MFVAGPKTWPNNFPEAAGQRQSPINISPVDLKSLSSNKKLEWKYVPEHTEDVQNTGYGWKVHVKGEGSGMPIRSLVNLTFHF